MTSIAILTRHVGHYHDARYRAVSAVAEATVLVIGGEVEFAQLAAPRRGDYRILPVVPGRRASRGRRQRELKAALTAALEEADPDVVVVAGWAAVESAIAIGWARTNRRRVVLMSESQKQDAARNWPRELVKARVIGLCDAALVGGPSHAEYISALGMPSERIFLGYDAVDNDHFGMGAAGARSLEEENRERYKLPRRYLLLSARFIKKKNVPATIRAFAEAARQEKSSAELVVLGGGSGDEEERHITEAIENSGMAERVHLVGFRCYDDLPIYYGLADAFLHLSLTEQWGLVVNEAAAAGLPLVVSQTCGSAGVLVRPGENGFLVDPRDPVGMRDAIAKMLRLDPSELCAMGKKSREIVADWGPDRFARGLSDACASAMGRPPRSLGIMASVLLNALAISDPDLVT